jgi:hypothetical protein
MSWRVAFSTHYGHGFFFEEKQRISPANSLVFSELRCGDLPSGWSRAGVWPQNDNVDILIDTNGTFADLHPATGDGVNQCVRVMTQGSPRISLRRTQPGRPEWREAGT